MPVTRYDDYEQTESTDTEDRTPLIVTPRAMYEADLSATFGYGGEYGQSLGITFSDVEIVDGCLYADADKQKLKLFSWQQSNDMSPTERFERGDEPSADDANDFIRKTYAGNEKEYELVAARSPELTDEDGDVLVEATSKVRDFEFTDDGIEFGEYEDLGGDQVEAPDMISWYDGSSDHGPSVSARTLAETLTEFGEDAVIDEGDIHNWLRDTSGSNVLRDDLQDRRVRFFIVTRSGEDYQYNLPIVEDLATGERIQPDNRSSDGDTGNSDPGESEEVQQAAERDAGSYPEPIADFINSSDSLNLTEERAENLLDELVEDENNSMTAEMVDDFGGKGALVNEVV